MNESTYELGDCFEPRRPFRLGRDAPSKMARRSIREHEVRAVLARNVVIGMVEERARYVLLGEVDGRALIVVVADDELDNATVLVSVYEPDEEHGWTPERIRATLDPQQEEDS